MLFFAVEVEEDDDVDVEEDVDDDDDDDEPPESTASTSYAGPASIPKISKQPIATVNIRASDNAADNILLFLLLISLLLYLNYTSSNFIRICHLYQ